MKKKIIDEMKDILEAGKTKTKDSEDKDDLASELLRNLKKNWEDPTPYEHEQMRKLGRTPPSKNIPKGKNKPPKLKPDGSLA
jgi:hypothetical protein